MNTARDAGFEAGLIMVPIYHPLSLPTYSVEIWNRNQNGDASDSSSRKAKILERHNLYVDNNN